MSESEAALNRKQGDLAPMWDELNTQWEPFRRGVNLYVVPKNARLRAIALPPNAILQYEPIEHRKGRTDE